MSMGARLDEMSQVGDIDHCESFVLLVYMGHIAQRMDMLSMWQSPGI